ncbi:sensor histidine kinase [Sediminibacterium sp.]|uniref:sensor histidine kinase n=1 Tax=Sediminibacterium sp. TaxID=1917865 RepID=UPI003F70774E
MIQTISDKNRAIQLIAHLAAWICFFSLPYLVFFPRLRDFSMSNHMLTVIILNNIMLVVFFYLNTQVLIPKFLIKEKWLLYVLSLVGCLLFFLYVPRTLAMMIHPPEIPLTVTENTKGINLRSNRIGRIRRRPYADFFNTVLFLLVITFGACIEVVRRWLQTEQNRKETEHERINTELSFLKSQVNPHFFFNTLNNIYSLAIVKSDKTAHAVLKLSAIMRYILTETERNLVPLENEVSFIHNYIELQQVRLTEKVQVNFTIEGNSAPLLVAPLIFIPFVENAFKYGVSTKENSSIDITLKITDHTIYFYAKNFIVQSENNLMENTGIGINNVKRRLSLLYPEKYTLSNITENGYYIVNLSINTLS